MTARNKELRDSYKTMNCAVPGCDKTPCDPEHFLNSCGLKERETPQNIWPCCRRHHTEKGKIGRNAFVEKNGMYGYFRARGFEFCEVSKKWYIPA